MKKIIKKAIRRLPTLLCVLGGAVVLAAAGNDDFSVFIGEGSSANNFMCALSGIALILIGAVLSEIRKKARR